MPIINNSSIFQNCQIINQQIYQERNNSIDKLNNSQKFHKKKEIKIEKFGKTIFIIIILIIFFGQAKAYIAIGQTISYGSSPIYYTIRKGTQLLWVVSQDNISIYNVTDPLNPIMQASSLTLLRVPPSMVAISDDTNTIALVGEDLSSKLLILQFSIYNSQNQSITNICNNFTNNNAFSSIGFTDANNQVVISYINRNASLTLYIFYQISVSNNIVILLSSTNPSTINIMKKNIAEKRLYFLNQFGSLFYFNMNSSNAITYKKITPISIVLSNGNLKPYDYVFLSTGNLILYFQNNVTSTGVVFTIISIFSFNSFISSYTQIGTFQHPSIITSLIQFDLTLTTLDINGNTRQLDISQAQRGTITELFSINLNTTGGVTFVYAGIAILTQTSNNNQIYFEINPKTNQTYPYVFINQNASSSLIKLIIKGYQMCLNNPNRQYCSNCNLSMNNQICIGCLSGYLLDTANNTCSVIPIIRDLFCPLGKYKDPITNQCVQIICSNQNCLICLFSPKFCNRCKQGEGLILIQGNCQFVQGLKTIQQTSESFATALSIPGLKFYIQPFDPFFAFLDDFWYYIYHDRNYSISVKIVFNSIKFINQLKMTPQFIDFSFMDANMNITNSFLVNDYVAYTPLTYFQQEENDIQYLINTHEMYTWNYIFGLAVFIIFRITHKILNKYVKTKQSVLGAIKDYFMQNSLYKCLFLIFIEGNLMFISFQAALQLRQPSLICFNDRFNMIFAVVSFFSAMIFSICFYVLIYALLQKDQAQIFLTYTKGNLSGFIVQTIQNGLKNFFSGFIHAYLIYNYRTQIISLIILKIFIDVNVFIFRKKYLNKGIFISFFIYYTGGFILDIILLCDTQNAKELTSLAFTQLVIIGIMSCSSIINVFSVLFQPIKSLFLYFKKKNTNSVKPQLNLQKQNIVIFQQMNENDKKTNKSKQKQIQIQKQKQNQDIQKLNLTQIIPNNTPFNYLLAFKNLENNIIRNNHTAVAKSKKHVNKEEIQQFQEQKAQEMSKNNMPIIKRQQTIIKKKKIKRDPQAKLKNNTDVFNFKNFRNNNQNLKKRNY